MEEVIWYLRQLLIGTAAITTTSAEEHILTAFEAVRCMAIGIVRAVSPAQNI